MSYQIDDDVYPGTAIVFIVATWGNISYSGTGVLVGRNDILTSAHVLYNWSLGGLADSVELYPSYNPAENPGPSHGYELVQYFPGFDPDGDRRVFPGDFNANTYAGSELDIALISTRMPLGDTFGWFGIDYDFTGGSVGTIGHPGVYGTRMMFDSGTAYNDAIDGYFAIQSDLEINPGNSGGPIYYDYGNGPYAVGLVSTRIAATEIGAHRYWLENALTDNDRLVIDYPGHTVSGGNGNDRFGLFTERGFFTSVGDDTVFAGGGLDVVEYRGPGSDYSVLKNGSALSVRDQTGYEGNDTLYDVERLVFSNGTLAFDLEGNAGQAYRIYQAAFDRIPDTGGLKYWIDVLDDGVGLLKVASGFIGSNEFTSVYGRDASASFFVAKLYENVLGRSGEAAGVQYWTGQLEQGQSREVVLAGFSESAENKAGVMPFISDGIWYA
ncbi:MAG: DUF4214 domain-containing protein [Hoeflea sp.]|nr:DUF4214 domain-containing protein [Hoeflea sp.]